MKARFPSSAELEFKEALEFYENAQVGLGLKFLSDAEAATRLTESYLLA